jgi:hypothetical protein
MPTTWHNKTTLAMWQINCNNCKVIKQCKGILVTLTMWWSNMNEQFKWAISDSREQDKGVTQRSNTRKS